MVAGSVIGMLASFLQTLEKLSLLKNGEAALYCNINSVFSCTNVLNAPQSSVFGFPNSIMCLILFTIFFAIGLVGVMGGQIPRKLRLATQFLSLFTLGFGLWFMWQSVYAIAAVCIFCLFCLTGLLAVNWAWLRLNAADYTGAWGKRAQAVVASGRDTYVWLLIAAVVVTAIVTKFYI